MTTTPAREFTQTVAEPGAPAAAPDAQRPERQNAGKGKFRTAARPRRPNHRPIRTSARRGDLPSPAAVRRPIWSCGFASSRRARLGGRKDYGPTPATVRSLARRPASGAASRATGYARRRPSCRRDSSSRPSQSMTVASSRRFAAAAARLAAGRRADERFARPGRWPSIRGRPARGCSWTAAVGTTPMVLPSVAAGSTTRYVWSTTAIATGRRRSAGRGQRAESGDGVPGR